MFIESLEFTIPVDLCSLCSTLQKGSLSDLEFPASVNSYGTTQDASIQVALRANKLTFKVDGVSSNASIISKSECKTLKLSVFDVDRSLIPQENIDFNSSNVSHLHHSSPVSNIGKRTFEHTSDSSTPIRAKIRRNSHDSNRRKNKSPTSGHASDYHTNHQSKQQTSNNVIVKTEPEDPDLIEIEPDPEPIKTEDPQIQTDNSVNAYPQLSQSSTSSFERNVPHVPDYAEASTSHHRHDNQSADDFLVFQDDTYDGEDNEGDYSNDGATSLEFLEFGNFCSFESPMLTVMKNGLMRSSVQYAEVINSAGVREDASVSPTSEDEYHDISSPYPADLVDETAVYLETLDTKGAHDEFVDGLPIKDRSRSRRFASVDESDLGFILPDGGAKSTLKNTNWGVNIFKQWLRQHGKATEFESLQPEELCQHLRHFYAEVRTEDGQLYSKSSYVGLRAAIHRHIRAPPYERNINILQDKEFLNSNNVFFGMLKRTKELGRDTAIHHEPISQADLYRIREYQSADTPPSLQRKVWFDLTFGFGRRGCENQREFTLDTFAIGTDCLGMEYITMTQIDAAKKLTGGLHDKGHARIYATGTRLCPVASFRKYCSKLNPLNSAFFQQPRKHAGAADDVWYTLKPLGHNTLSQMMKTISTKSKLSRIYTNYCLRVTTVTPPPPDQVYQKGQCLEDL